VRRVLEEHAEATAIHSSGRADAPSRDGDSYVFLYAVLRSLSATS